ncbi:PTS sugar transporter subunit IIA [Gimesia fumaroli]|uniref:PTS system fructose-specific EIIABC component n=1 Tax=Gimesia fumaroli TaxID=2527976 RepID=A0A518I812_9PLAN|nr:PTS sugar transporter subunit IIA [Gimesia fumaroli]QDV49230.1 PTS system fructose-specific EIIABC component [Gimesia fumaroli]
MAHEPFSLNDLSKQLGRDRRELEKLANRGRIPGRKVKGEWQFHPTEITHWLEEEMRSYTTSELELVEQTNAPTELDSNHLISSLMPEELIEVPLNARTKRSVLESLIEVAGRTWQIWEPATVLTALQQREEAYPTAFENGVAIPHPRNPIPDAVGEPLIAYGRTLTGIPFGAQNGRLTDIFFLVICSDASTHLSVLARLGRMLQLPDFVEQLREATTPHETHEIIIEAENKIAESQT